MNGWEALVIIVGLLCLPLTAYLGRKAEPTRRVSPPPPPQSIYDDTRAPFGTWVVKTETRPARQQKKKAEKGQG